jgi:hypothetical protein
MGPPGMAAAMGQVAGQMGQAVTGGGMPAPQQDRVRWRDTQEGLSPEQMQMSPQELGASLSPEQQAQRQQYMQMQRERAMRGMAAASGRPDWNPSPSNKMASREQMFQDRLQSMRQSQPGASSGGGETLESLTNRPSFRPLPGYTPTQPTPEQEANRSAYARMIEESRAQMSPERRAMFDPMQYDPNRDYTSPDYGRAAAQARAAEMRAVRAQSGGLKITPEQWAAMQRSF